MARRVLSCLVLTQVLASQAALLSASRVFAAESGVDGLHAAPLQSVTRDGLGQQEDGASAHRLFLPFDAQTGVAAFWSGPDFIVVADRAVPVLAHGHGGSDIFSSLDVTVLDTATLVRLHLPAHPLLALLREPDGWSVQAESPASPLSPAPVSRPGAILFPLKQPGWVVSLPDPASGGRLLIATARVGSGRTEQVRRAVGYSVQPSLQGVVIAADSGQIALRATPEGAVVDAVALHALPVGDTPAPLSAGAHGQDWAWLGLQDAPEDTLRTRMQAQVSAALRAGAGLSAEKRLAAAQAAFAAGQPAQALQVLEASGASPTTAGGGSVLASVMQRVTGGAEEVKTATAFLRAASALLAGHPTRAQVLDGPDFGDSPQTRVWRGLYLMQTGGDSRTASLLLATGFEQVRAYPAPVRALLLPQMATYVARFGDAAAMALPGTLPDDSLYDLPRALLQARGGNVETARVALENLTASSSPRIAAYARAALVGLMLEHDMLAPATAVQAYGKLLENEGQPGALPAGPKAVTALGLAHALTVTGKVQAALAVLDGLHAGPDIPQDVLAAAYQTALRDLIFPPAGQEQVLKPAARLALVGSHLSRVDEGGKKAKLLVGYGRLLLAAGQPDAAARAFSQAVALQAEPVARAEAEDFLAQAGLQARRPALAQKALDRATAPAMPGDLATQRTYDAARLAAASGDPGKALRLLAEDESDAGLDLRGQLYESAHRWGEAVQVVGRLASRGLPEQGGLTEPQRNLALRLATDAAAAHDSETLVRLKDWLAGRTLGRERDALLAMKFQEITPHNPAH
ncbi:hypothetical protein OQ252_09330 [Acetobacter farinalis]|uniref:Uncharacterized protein n=1 Tax=Acetobacter farinalis TaxID=1260984 RepID=A0ABT3Q8J2_9PROT|nr:hypothetical protein [Acetobacter farinalis]MCX2561594.1 hypothetical protein [Acetobacter farinalis]NHO30093.1 hypothetical protein [Acetobacter farinalis]